MRNVKNPAANNGGGAVMLKSIDTISSNKHQNKVHYIDRDEQPTSTIAKQTQPSITSGGIGGGNNSSAAVALLLDSRRTIKAPEKKSVQDELNDVGIHVDSDVLSRLRKLGLHRSLAATAKMATSINNVAPSLGKNTGIYMTKFC